MTMHSRRLSSVLLLCGAVASADAFEIEYAEDRPAQLAQCDQLLYAGEDSAANACFLRLVNDDEDPRIKADASRRLGEFQAANSYFQTAIREYPDDAQVRTRWGELFLASHQNNEALKLFQEALEIDPEYRPAMRGLVKIGAEGFSDQANEWLDEILDIEADDIEALLLRARLQLEDGAIDEGEASLQNALRVAQERGVTPLEVYALLASVDLLRDITDSEWTRRALALNAKYGEAYATPAYFYVITRRYREAVELLRKAVAAEPRLWSAHAELGTNLLRDNHIVEGSEHLRIAYAGDPFSTQVVNTLRLLDSLDNFTFKGHGEMEVDGAIVPQVFLRLHEDETQVLEPYALELIYDSIRNFSERYDFALKEPVIVELYPEHDDFAVRTLGLPGIGLLGVTFGYLVAMDSPTGRPRGEFHWGTTLWHEMAHIFTLEATNHLVPRWFSEGVSVHEEWSTGPLDGRHISLAFMDALAQDQLLPIAELDRGFIRPTYPSQVIVSYMQAGLICNYISENFGQDRLSAMLHAFTDGADTETALAVATGLSAGEFDERFSGFIEDEFGAIVANMEAWKSAQEAAHQAAANENWEAAIELADAAIELFPEYVDEGSAWLVKARAQAALGRSAATEATLQSYLAHGGYSPDALYDLANRQHGSGRTELAVETARALTLVAPLQEQLHADYGDWLRAVGRSAEAVAEYQALLAMDPHDKASAHFRLAQAYLDVDEAQLSREHLLYALEIAPHFREAQDMLLETLL
jgi:tetratricopeptide (TPR) repeat protein